VSITVVSLVPSVTETLLAWDIVPVACTRFCEQPSLPTVGGTKNPDVSAIVDLRPDLVVVDEEENRREDADALTAAGLRVHVTAVRSVDDVGATLTALASAVGADPPRFRAPMRVPARIGARKRAFVPIWRRPWMTLNADTYGSSLLARFGIGNVFADHADRYPTVELEEVRGRHPDVVVVPTEPYTFTERHLPELADAVGAPAVLVDGKDLFWWGVRTPAALERLSSQLAPGVPPLTA
jgi:ABC-type Fe3+-hydroxamate transport system substrate-binding protein